MHFRFILIFFILEYAKINFAQENSHEFAFANIQRDITKIYRANLHPLIANINEDIEPCNNFFDHVCNNYHSGSHWLNTNKDSIFHDDVAENRVPPFLYNIEDRMHFFEDNLKNFETKSGVMLSDLYEDCKNRNHYDVIHGAMPPRWQRMLYELEFLARKSYVYRQFPFLRFQWQNLSAHYKLNWISLAAKFGAHGLPILLHVFFAEGTIYIASGLGTESCPSLAKVESSLMPLLKNRNSQIAAIIGGELWTFCQKLKNTEESDTQSYALNDTIPLEQAYFQAFFTTLNLTTFEVEQARHIPIDLPRLQRLLLLLLNSEPRIVLNYVLWQAYMKLEYEDCYQLTTDFEDLLNSEYWSWHIFAPHFSRDAAMATFQFQTTRFQRHRKSVLVSDWDKFLFRKLLQKDFNIERMIRNYSSEFLHPTYMSEVYDKATLVTGYFYGNLLTLKRLKLRADFYRPAIDEEDLNSPVYFLRKFLDFTILMLHQPLFHYFSSQGFSLWDSSNLLYSSDGYYTALDCLEKQSLQHFYKVEELEDRSNIYNLLSTSEVDRVFRFHVAFYESLRDYNFWLSAETFAFAEDFVLEYFQMDSKRILFYATAQLYCGRNDALYSSLINRSFMNLDEFAFAFNCTEDSLMNPSMKCMRSNNRK